MRKKIISLGIGIAAVTFTAASFADTSPIVQTDKGIVRGISLEKGAEFRGIPFAQAPIGPLRWRDARQARPWHGIFDATQWGKTCPQQIVPNRPQLPQSEDCLNLNVITPDRNARGLPVLVVIHGGAYAFGSNHQITEQGISPLLARGMILVTPNYRVGRFGFFAHPALSAEVGRGTGNFWLSDQIMALKWVKNNISRFGGDPNRVTILGCSAGGSSVNALMASGEARGLFAQASARSAGGLFNANRPLARAEDQGLAFAYRAGVEGRNTQSLTQLRGLSIDQVLAADPGPPDYGAIIDKYYLSSPLSIIFAQSQQAAVPYLVGSTSNEASVFGLMGFDTKTLHDRFGIDFDATRRQYNSDNQMADGEVLRQVQTDFIFTSATMGMAGLASRKAPAWSYHFDYLPPALVNSHPGADHCADMPYLFGPLPDNSPQTLAVSKQMQDYLYNFVAHGNPNSPGLPNWPESKTGEISPLLIRENSNVVPNFRKNLIQIWWDKWKADNSQPNNP